MLVWAGRTPMNLSLLPRGFALLGAVVGFGLGGRPCCSSVSLCWWVYCPAHWVWAGQPSSPGSRGRYVSGDPVHDLASAKGHEWLATCVPVQDVLSQRILSSSTSCGISGYSEETCMLPPVGGNFWPCLSRVIFSHFFTLRLCRRDLRIPVCLFSGYNILNW